MIDSPVKHINVWLLASKPSIDKCYYLYDKIIELNLPINASPKSLYNMAMSKPQKLIDENNNDVLDFINKPKISQSRFNIAEIKSTELFLDDNLVNLPMMVATKQNALKDGIVL